MKKLLLLTLLASCVLCAEAQNSAKRRDLLRESGLSEPYKLDQYIRGGLNLSTISGVDSFDFDNNILQAGYFLGYGFTAPIFWDLYWGSEFALTTRGFGGEFEFPEYDQVGNDVEYIHAHLVQLTPINIGYRYALSDNVKLDLQVGVYLSYDYAGKYYYDDKFDDSYDLNYTFEEYAESKEMSYSRFDVGLNSGLGVWYKDKVKFDVQVKNGFMPIFEYDDDDDEGEKFGFTCNYMATVSFRF